MRVSDFNGCSLSALTRSKVCAIAPWQASVQLPSAFSATVLPAVMSRANVKGNSAFVE